MFDKDANVTSKTECISREAVSDLLAMALIDEWEPEYAQGRLSEIPAADVVPAEVYNHLLKIANKMHLWIFNHTFDEQAAYDECGLTDEDNAMLGYGGTWELIAGDGTPDEA